MAADSFSSEVKNELSRLTRQGACCQQAELSALLRTAGTIQIGAGRQVSLYVSTEHAAVARRIYQLGREIYKWEAEVLVRRSQRLKSDRRYMVRFRVLPEQKALLRRLGILRGNAVEEGIRPSLVKRQCCRKAYLRGAFLGGGSVARPENSYHLEIAAGSLPYAEDLQKLLERIGINARLYQRKQGWVVYLKEAQQIGEFLVFIGAHASLLHLEEVRLVKDMRGKVNRLVNCDTANLERAVSTGLRQAENIRYLVHELGWDKLPLRLRQVAEVRLRYPEASLSELAAILDSNLGKSGVNHRLRKLEQMAEELRSRK